MKRTSIFTILLLCFCSSCKTPQYIPVETTKIEYRDNYLRDSIYFRDSVFFAVKGDTVFLEKYSYLYRDKIVKDSIFKTWSYQRSKKATIKLAELPSMVRAYCASIEFTCCRVFSAEMEKVCLALSKDKIFSCRKSRRKSGFFYTFTTTRNGRETNKKRPTVSRKKKQSENTNKKAPTKGKNKSRFAKSGAKPFLDNM